MAVDTYTGAGGFAAPGGGGTAVNTEGRKYTYRYASILLTPVATPTDVVQIAGSSTMTGRIKRVAIWGTSAAAGTMTVNLIRRSTIGTIGSAVVTAITAGKMDPNDPAPTVTVGTIGTANWTTPGTSAGVLAAGQLTFSNAGAVCSPVIWDFSTRNDKPIYVRGTSDWVYLNMNGDTVPTTGKITFEIEIEEDNS